MFSFMYHLLLKRAVSWGLFWRWWISFTSPEHLNVMQKIKWYRWALVYFAGHVLVNDCGHPCGCNCVCNVHPPGGVCFEPSYWLYNFIVVFVISFILIALSLASLHCRSNLHSKHLCASRMFIELTHLIMQLMYWTLQQSTCRAFSLQL